jgi:hypothetical protein
MFLASVGDDIKISEGSNCIFARTGRGRGFYIQQGKIKLTVISEQGKEAVIATRALSSADVNSRRADAHHNP